MEKKHLTREDAEDFFGKLYRGTHHIPGKIKEHGYGFAIEDPYGMATFDSNRLTRFVILCHDECIRGEIKPSSPRSMKVCIWKRQGREGSMPERHPSIETAIESMRS